MKPLLFGLLGTPTIQYCESNLSGWLIEPANALSSLLISIVGVYILIRKHHAYSTPLGGIAIVLGLASFFYYATFTFVGQLADLGSMFLLLVFIIISAWERRRPIGPKLRLLIYAGVFLSCITVTATVKTINGFNLGIPMFVLLLAIAVPLELKAARADKLSLKYLIMTFISFLAGFVFWWLDYKKLWCLASTEHYLNGHAVWHLFNAIALVCLDQHYGQLSRRHRYAP